MILSLLLEEDEIHFSKEELALFEEHFLPYGLSPTHFRKAIGRAKWVEAPAGAVLATEGEPLPQLLLIANGRVQASVNKVKTRGGGLSGVVDGVCFPFRLAVVVVDRCTDTHKK